MKALVTGGGGFLGHAIVQQLVARGDEARSFSRGTYAALDRLGAEHHRGDLADAAAVRRAVAGCDLVFHVGAKAGAWGKYEQFYQTNVVGTNNVIDACREAGVRYLVYTSSPSVVFDGSDLEGVDESVPYPSDYDAHYPQTKALAERAVVRANDAQLRTVSLRPHLVWGPGDNHLVPRIVARGRSGQLRRFRGPPKLVDTTYVDDAARAHLLAADRLLGGAADGIAGKVYFISSGQPIALWEMVDRILVAAGLSRLEKTIDPHLAFRAGWLLEKLHGLLRIDREPRMTRWVARELSTAHWFDIGAAKRDLGYEPAVSLDEGLSRLQRWLVQHEPA
jgi:nucleoside-diphosphate-sugar epimerase